jgi:RNA polymerase sigma-70 factor (ECF subfamily)
LDFSCLVALYYRDLYHFAFGLTRSPNDAADLTQQTFYIWGRKGYQLRDISNVKTWLFTTLRREFLEARRRHARQLADEWTNAAEEIVGVEPEMINRLDAETMLHFLARIDDAYRIPLILYYLEDMPYKEIAELLEVPIGTVQSRISRGKAVLYRLLTNSEASKSSFPVIAKKVRIVGNKFAVRASHLCNHSADSYSHPRGYNHES